MFKQSLRGSWSGNQYTSLSFESQLWSCSKPILLSLNNCDFHLSLSRAAAMQETASQVHISIQQTWSCSDVQYWHWGLILISVFALFCSPPRPGKNIRLCSCTVFINQLWPICAYFGSAQWVYLSFCGWSIKLLSHWTLNNRLLTTAGKSHWPTSTCVERLCNRRSF